MVRTNNKCSRKKKIRGLFLSHHQGFIGEMRRSFCELENIDFLYRYSLLDYEVMAELARHYKSLVGKDSFEPTRLNYDSDTIDGIKRPMLKKWAGMKESLVNYYRHTVEVDKFDFIVLGLGIFIYDIIRDLSKDIPVIYYPLMLDNNYEYVTCSETSLDNFIYVIHDEELLEHSVFPGHSWFIKGALNPACYGPYVGDYRVLMTIFNLINGDGSLWNMYDSMSSGFDRIILGKNLNDVGLNLDNAVMPDTIRRFRCALAFSRMPTAIATAQILLSGVPMVAAVDDRNELNRTIVSGESGFIVKTAEEAKGVIEILMNNHEYCCDVGEKGKAAYMKTHDFASWRKEWTGLIECMVMGDKAYANGSEHRCMHTGVQRRGQHRAPAA